MIHIYIYDIYDMYDIYIISYIYIRHEYVCELEKKHKHTFSKYSPHHLVNEQFDVEFTHQTCG